MSNIADLLEVIYKSAIPDLQHMERILSLDDTRDLETLFSFSDRVRKEFCGDGIILRGIIEFSNFCSRECFYCGLGKFNHELVRYRMSKSELLESVAYLASCNIKTVVLQSGEDPGLDPLWLEDVILDIKSRFDLAITLSVGERNADDYRIWRQAGADRYLLKIEASDKDLYSSMHPRMSFAQRLSCLNTLKSLGYQVGSGNIIGLPGQTLKNLAQDIIFFKQHNFDMVGIGPFIPHPATPFAGQKEAGLLLTLKAIALTRIVTRNAHLPATTALGSLESDYRSEGLKCGANVLMPNFTPQPYRRLYEIYPGKRCVDEAAGAGNLCTDSMAKTAGRPIDYSKGNSLKEKGVSLNV